MAWSSRLALLCKTRRRHSSIHRNTRVISIGFVLQKIAPSDDRHRVSHRAKLRRPHLLRRPSRRRSSPFLKGDLQTQTSKPRNDQELRLCSVVQVCASRCNSLVELVSKSQGLRGSRALTCKLRGRRRDKAVTSATSAVLPGNEADAAPKAR